MYENENSIVLAYVLGFIALAIVVVLLEYMYCKTFLSFFLENIVS